MAPIPRYTGKHESDGRNPRIQACQRTPRAACSTCGGGFALLMGVDGVRVTEIDSSVADHIEQLVDRVAKEAVTFECPQGLQLDNKGIWTTPDRVAKVCCFKDPDGGLF